jgi:aldehyde:ferredoxin oxidoreductase
VIGWRKAPGASTRVSIWKKSRSGKGLEVAYHDPRGVSGMALSYATSPRGACHNQSDYFFVDWGHSQEKIGIEYLPPHAQAEKSAYVAKHQNWRTMFNAIVMCIFANVEPDEQVKLINAACGLNWTLDELMRSGERAWNLNVPSTIVWGLTAENDNYLKHCLNRLQMWFCWHCTDIKGCYLLTTKRVAGT